jgi:uncharacterized protein (UPF0335 family)
MICERAMSGVEISKVAKEKGIRECGLCMHAVVYTFRSFQEQIKRLRSEKANLQEEIKNLRKIGEEQTRVMAIEIRALKEEVDVLKKESKSSESVDSLA